MSTEQNVQMQKFDGTRAAEYEHQSRIALAGYEACHELSACMLVATIGQSAEAEVLVAGAGGTAQEIVTIAALRPFWTFTAVDPSKPMLDLAQAKLKERNLSHRVKTHLGDVSDLGELASFEAATLIGVLHHVAGYEKKLSLLRSISTRMKPNAPFILACNHYAYGEEPLMLKAWSERWRMAGTSEEDVQAKLSKILEGADPPRSEEDVFALLQVSGFRQPKRFFSSLFWGAWISFAPSISRQY